jgi:hypothetical protein
MLIYIKDSTQPNKTCREDDETDLNNYNKSTNKKKSQEGFGGYNPGDKEKAFSTTNEMKMIRRSLSTLGFIIKALGM